MTRKKLKKDTLYHVLYAEYREFVICGVTRGEFLPQVVEDCVMCWQFDLFVASLRMETLSERRLAIDDESWRTTGRHAR